MNKKADLSKMEKRKPNKKKDILSKTWKELKRDFDQECAQMDLEEIK
jgi:hypothetical protein